MSDVLARLMRWLETSEIDDAHIVLRDAITEIAGLRARLDERRLMPTLTEEERRAIKSGIAYCEDITYGGPNDEEAAAVLRRLLERLG